MLSLVRRPRWLGLLALAAALCVLFWWLGTWQWHRHEDRSARNEAVHAAQVLPTAPLTEVMPHPDVLPAGAEYRTVTASGHYLADPQLLQRNPSGQAGFAVVTPLVLDTGGTLLVNRGFVRFSTTEPNTPASDVAPPPGPVHVDVRLRAAQDGAERAAPSGEIYAIDPALYPQPLNGPVYAAYGDLVDQTPAPSAELELPAPTDLGLGPHLFYAFQWWSFIAIAIIGYVLLLRREAQTGPTVGSSEHDTPATASSG